MTGLHSTWMQMSEWVINNYDGGAGLGQHDLLDEALHKIQDAKALYELRKKL